MLVLYNTRRSSTLRREHRTKPQVERPSEKSLGWVAERSIATVLKTVVGATPPGVRIPPHPPENNHAPSGACLFCGSVGRMRTLVRQQVDLPNDSVGKSSRLPHSRHILCRARESLPIRQEYDASRGTPTGCSFSPRSRRFLTATLPVYIASYAKSAQTPHNYIPCQKM